MNIEITFINDTDDMNNTEVVIIQKNIAPSAEQTAVAWNVIENCGRGWSHAFNYPLNYSVGAADCYGNLTPQITASNGLKWELAATKSGNILELSQEPATRFKGVEIKNNLLQGSFDAQIYRDGKLLATKKNLVPLQKAIFEFAPTIWVAAMTGIEEGQILSPILLSEFYSEISLMGINKANLIMTGGGIGPEAKPYSFILEPTY